MWPFIFLSGVALGTATALLVRQYLVSRQPKEVGLADRLPWALLVEDGVILCKDATLLGGFVIRGEDLSTAPYTAVNLAADLVREMIGQLPLGYSLEMNVHRNAHQVYLPRGARHFPTPTLLEVDREREFHFKMPGQYYASTATLLVSFTPPKESVSKMEGFFVKGTSLSVNYPALIAGFQQTLDELMGHLAPGFSISRMDSTRLVTECHQCLSGDPEPVIPDGGYLNYALASGDWYSGFVPRFRDQHLHLVTITGFGPSVQAAAGDFFNTIQDDVRWHLRFLPLSRAQSEAKLKFIQKSWFSQRQGLRQFLPGGNEDGPAVEDVHAIAMQKETAEAHAELSSGESRFGHMSNTIVVRDMDEKRGRARAMAIVQRAREAGFIAMIESVNAPAAFMGSLPAFGAVNHRRFLVTSKVVSHLFPTTQSWTGNPANPSALFPKNSPPLMQVSGRGANPFSLNLHHGDVGHTLVVGATGAGKSVLVGSLMFSWLRYEHSRVVCFDVGRSHAQLTRRADGEHVDLGHDESPPLQPLHHLDTDTDLLWAQAWVTGICSMSQVKMSPEDRVEIGNAIQLVAAELPEHRTLTALHTYLPPSIREVFEPYSGEGTFASIFDGVETGVESDARMKTYELRDVLSMGEEVIGPLLLALFRKVERALDGHPTLIVIEEAWAALMRTDFRDRLQQWLLTLRKQNAAVIIVAHNPIQIRSLSNSGIITDSCPTRLLLPNPEARVQEHAEVYRHLDLNPREIEMIATAKPKRDYYCKSPHGSCLFDLKLGAKAKQVLFPPRMSDPKPEHSELNGQLKNTNNLFHLAPPVQPI